MALPKEPRQKMINIMYLVLTALLALNVSAEILNAFTTVDNSLRGTNATVNNSTETILASLQEKTTDPTSREKALIWLPKAQQAQALTKSMNAYIETLRERIHKEAGFDPAKNGDSSFKADNLDIATRIMVEGGEGKKLQARLQQYKTDIAKIDPSFGELVQIDLTMPKTQNKSNKTWEDAYFHMVPTVAAMTILSKFQNDVKTSENRVVAHAHEQVGKVTVRYDTFAAIVGQSSNYVMPGQTIDIYAGVGAFSKAAAPQITINGSGAALGIDGQAKMTVPSGGLGKHSVPVVIRFQDQDGKMQTVTKNVDYTVGQASASIALDKMNVLYIGIANPITVAASGGGDDKIGVSLSGAGGRLDKTGAGKYNAWVTGGDKATITVSVEGKVAGASEFRIRNIPAPTGTVGGYASGDNVNAGAFRAQSGVGAYIKDFPFDLKYTVTAFTISTDSDDGDIVDATVNGNTWTTNAQARNVISQVKPGKTVYIDNIRATGENGKSYKLGTLVYYIK
jgi:gliding motility-associated protein GldM